MSPNMRSRPTPDGDIAYADSELGKSPILFIPGFGGVGRFWSKQLEHFGATHRVLTYDHRGTGNSAKTRIRYSIDQMATDALSVIEAATLDRVALVGHSTGGAIAQLLAARYPDRITRAVLSSTWMRPSAYFSRSFGLRRALLERGDFAAYHELGLLLRYPPEDIEARQWLFDEVPALDKEITISRIDALLASDVSAHTAQIVQPCLVLAAADDFLVPPFMSRDLAAAIPNARIEVFPYGGHYSPETVPDDYNKMLAGFLT